MNGMLMLFVLLLAVPQFARGSASLPVKAADSPIMGKLGTSVVLPCWVDPSQDVSSMEVRWYRPHHFNTPILFYQNKNVMTESQDENYRNRTSLAQRNNLSAGLKGGDVSLKLENLNAGDEGAFHCYVSGDKEYGTAIMTLNVHVLGSSPVLSVQSKDDMMNVSCSSCGWHPEPSVEWKSDRTTPIQPGSLLYSTGKNNLTCVQSWALFSPSKSHQAFCSIFISEEYGRESTLDIQSISHLMVSEECSAGSWMALFAVALIAALVMIGVSVFLYRKNKLGYMQAKQDEEGLVSVSPKINMEDLKKDAVSITLNTSKISQDLMVNSTGKVVRDRPSAAGNYKGPGFPYYLSVWGNEDFNSGCAYWEVELTKKQTRPKQSWLIGVTQASANLTNNKCDLTPSKGFWFLCSDGQTGLHVNTEPEIALSVQPTLEIVGVLLQYEVGELSFYNAKEGIHLFTMKTHFDGAIVPIFNPGIGDEAPLTVTPTEARTQSKGTTEPAENAGAQTNDSKSAV